MRTKAALGLLFLAFACDSSTAPKPKPSAPAVANWGGGKGDVGNEIPEEGAPTSVRSFAVDDAGSVYLLDALNTRIAGYVKGKATDPVALPAGRFDDIALLPAGGFALLDNEKGAIKYLDASGGSLGETALQPLGVPAARVTALEVSDAVWVEVDGEYSVKVADTEGKTIAPESAPATLLLSDFHYSLQRKTSQLTTLYRSPAEGGPRTALGQVDFGQSALEWRLFQSPKPDELWVLARVAKTEGEAGESVLFIQVGTDGVEKSRKELAGNEGVEESFRWARSAPNGKLYWMRFTESGVRVEEVTP